MNPILTPPDELQREKKKQAALTSALGTKEPGSPVSAPESGIAAKPKTVDIGGIAHLDLPDQKFTGPLSMASDAAVGTIRHIATAPFGNRTEERLAANRAELNNETAEPQAKTKPSPSTMGITGGVQALVNQGVSDLAGRQAGHMIENNLRSFEDKGNGITRQVGTNGIASFTNVGTAEVTDPTKKVQVNSYDGAGENESMAKANAIRQALIDRQPQGGLGILGDGGVEAANAEKTARWRQDELLSAASGGNRAAGEAIQANARMAGDQIHSATAQRGQDITSGIMARSQDVTAQTEANRLAGNPVDNQLKLAQTKGIIAQSDNAALITDLRKQMISETDPVKRSAAQEALLAAQGQDANRGRFVKVGGGEEVVDGISGKAVRRPDLVMDSRSGKVVSQRPEERPITNEQIGAIGRKTGVPPDTVKDRLVLHDGGWKIRRLEDVTNIDVEIAIARGTPPEQIATAIKKLGGNPTEYGI